MKTGICALITPEFDGNAMRRLFDDWETTLARMAGAHLLLMLDFDGTLAPIAPTPVEATLPPETRSVLERLTKSPRCTVVLVSGRAIDDIRAKVGIDGVAYIGSHGLESAGVSSPSASEPPKAYGEALSRARRELAARLADSRGVIFEEKRYSLAVHYRGVEEIEIPRVENAVREAVADLGVSDLIEIARGKKVLELRPRLGWNKGTVVEDLLRAEAARRRDDVFPVYIGDDITDEDGFRALAGRGLAVIVGERPDSSASHFVEDTEEVTRMLRDLAGRFGAPPAS